MSYITPRVLIQQEFLQVPVYSEFPLSAFVIGPNFHLSRYSEASEKPFTAVGTLDGVAISSGNQYLPEADTTYDIPNIPAGGNVDPTYTKLFAEAVEAQYFPHEDLGSTTPGLDEVTFVTNSLGAKYSNRVRFNGLSAALKTANGFTRSEFLSNRDVRVGDIIEVTNNLGESVRGKITALEAETSDINEDLSSQIAPKVGLASYSDGSSNGSSVLTSATLAAAIAAGTVNASDLVGKYITLTAVAFGVRKILAITPANALALDAVIPSTSTGINFYVGGVYNDVNNQAKATGSSSLSGPTIANITAVDGTDVYYGYARSNILSDVYTATVQVGGDVSAVKFSIKSQNGAFPIREYVGLTDSFLTVDDYNNNDVGIDFDGSTGTFTVGAVWTLTVQADVTQVNPTASGEYTGALDMTYKLLVERGGAFYDGTNASTCARVLITSSQVDTSTLVLPQEGETFDVGSFGVMAEFSAGSNNGGLITGDTYYIPVKASKPGAVTIVEFAENLSEATLGQEDITLTAKLFLAQSSIQVPEVRDIVTDERNWSQEDAYITVKAGITSYDSAILVGGTPARLPVAAAKLFVEHRDLLQDYVTAIDSVRNLADVATKLGTVHPDNPLAQGVYDAVLNAANQAVYFIGVGTNDLAGYTEAIKISEKSEKVYSFVPMTFDRQIQDAVTAHVNAYSTPEVGRWRIAWLAVEDVKTSVIYDLQEDGTSYTCTITDDPMVSGVQNRLVTINGAKFLEDGVRPNDSLRVNHRLNADGKLIYDEYVVDHVRTNTTLVLTKNLSAPITQPTKCEVIRNFTKSERASNIAAVGGGYNNRRVRVVFPDTFKYGKTVKQGYFAAAGLAGLRSGVVPHQGLTNSEYLGADDLSKVVLEFTQDDLDTMAAQGVWLITQEVIGATPYVRHQLTTDESSLNTSEDSITTNVDSLSYALKNTLKPFVGRYNVNIENLTVVRSAVIQELTYRATSTYTARAGNQLVSFNPKDDIIRLEQNSTFKDRIDAEVRLNVPYPMNYISLKLIV
jgi:hypothetical protein